MALNIVHGLDLKSLGYNSTDYLHVLTETLKLAFADRDQYIADPRFVKDIPVAVVFLWGESAGRSQRFRLDSVLLAGGAPRRHRRRRARVARRRVALLR